MIRQKYIILILLAACFKLSAQNLDYLESQDTLYIAFDELDDKSVVKKTFENFYWEAFGDKTLSEYSIREKDSSRLIFIRVPNESLYNPSITVNRKKFLKKNKDKILTLEFISRYYPKDLFFKYLGARTYAPSLKVIYFIDEKSLKQKNRKIVLKRANIITFGYGKI